VISRTVKVEELILLDILICFVLQTLLWKTKQIKRPLKSSRWRRVRPHRSKLRRRNDMRVSIMFLVEHFSLLSFGVSRDKVDRWKRLIYAEGAVRWNVLRNDRFNGMLISTWELTIYFIYLKFIFNKVHKNKHCILSIKKRKPEKGLTQGIELVWINFCKTP